MMQESYLKLGNECLFMRHNDVQPGRTTLLFVHGLGESGLCFREIFKDERFREFNIVVPDLPGYGRSSRAENNDYSFDSHINRLWTFIKEKQLSDIVAIGHSMGGDITTLLCASDKKGKIKKYVNIEGDITENELFFSSLAVEAGEKGESEEWFHDTFMLREILSKLAEKFPLPCKRYYASLCFSRWEAFLQNSRELVRRNTSGKGAYRSEIGEKYISLSIPKVFFYGTGSLSNKTRTFLAENNLESQPFEGASHWVMIDKPHDFGTCLIRFIIGG
ncbi:MAG: alpha/beta hydrolase [bacterium]|nr:alpha/beta hydrolase [bacterium]